MLSGVLHRRQLIELLKNLMSSRLNIFRGKYLSLG
jgi:hypothetical protein